MYMIVRLALMVVAAVILIGVIDSSAARGKGSRRRKIRATRSPGWANRRGEARALEDAVKADPENVDARVTLLGYYMRKQFADAASRAARQGHILWMVENRPNAELLSTPYARIDAILDAPVYEKVPRPLAEAS